MAISRSKKVMNHIPNDLAFSILSKLPLKSLKRFGCVCQTWALLFENPHFKSKFRTNFISHCHSDYIDTFFLLYEDTRSHDNTCYCDFYSLSGKRYENRVKLAFPNPFQDENPFFRLFDCDNITGIVCLKQDNTLVFWKPTTNEFKVIPSSFAETLSPYREPLIYYHGFGFDPIKDDIKNGGEHFLVSFDLSNEIFITTPIPLDIPPDIDPDLNILLLRKHLVMLNGSISSILWYTNTFHISTFGELGISESWTKLFVVGPFPDIHRVVGTRKNGDIFFKTKDGKLVLFDLNTGIFEDTSFKGGHAYDIAIFKENHILINL